jgi:hypothetical protein
VSSLTISQIQVKQTRTSTLPGQARDSVESSVPLDEKIDEYIFKLGCTSAHTLGVVVQLLTVGKVRLDFREYNERLQLENPAHILSRSDAMRITEEYLTAVREKTSAVSDESDVTQKIIIQAPKRTVL